MQRDIGIKIKDFPTIPASLRSGAPSSPVKSHIPVDLGRLYHHYYMDSYDTRPPDPNPAEFEYLRFLAATKDFRFLDNGPGVGTAKRRSISSELGQAFCRWFLHDHLGIPYFAHMEHVLEKETHPAFDGMGIVRTKPGDVPDYLCARSVASPFIAEAKGRFSSIGFNTVEFKKWRDQFTRIEVQDKTKRARSLKGFIVGTRFVTEKNKPSLWPTLYAEDPKTPGEVDLNEQQLRSLARGAISVHYAYPTFKLGLRLFSSALLFGFSIPDELKFQVAVWKCRVPPLQGREFIGGVYTPPVSCEHLIPYMIEQRMPSLIDLGRPQRTFVGLDINVIKQLSVAVRGNWRELDRIEPYSVEVFNPHPSQLNWLQDGTVTAPDEFFEPVEVVSL